MIMKWNVDKNNYKVLASVQKCPKKMFKAENLQPFKQRKNVKKIIYIKI